MMCDSEEDSAELRQAFKESEKRYKLHWQQSFRYK